MASGNSTGRELKVSRLIEAYDLVGLGAEMERLWTADGGERKSLRDLADRFNTELLASALATAGEQALDGEVANTYRLLTDDEVSSADRTRTVRDLERKGVDVDRLETDFVTYQAIRSYLTEAREASYSTDEVDRVANVAENLQRLRGRASRVTESKLDGLSNAGELTLGEFQTFVDVSVYCADCDTRFDVEELLARGGCACAP